MLKVQKITLQVTAYSSELETYGEKGLKELWENILERYGHEEYYEPVLVESILKERGRGYQNKKDEGKNC